MALSSTSTDAEVFAAFDDNVDYDLVRSEFKARELIKACRILISRTADQASYGGDFIAHRVSKYQEIHDAALKWLRKREGTRYKLGDMSTGWRS